VTKYPTKYNLMEAENPARHLRNLYTGGNIAEVVSEETKELNR
jgi:hypothetical protein